MDKLTKKDWLAIASLSAIVIARIFVRDERDYLTKQPDGTYK